MGFVALAFDATFLSETDRFGFTNLSALNRFANFLSLFEVFAENPFVGAGFNFVRALYDERFYGVSGNYVDGGVLLLLASLGIGGVLVVVVSLWMFLRGAGVAPKLFVPIGALIVVQSFATSPMFSPLIMCYMAALLAFSPGYAERQEQVHA